MKIKKIHYEGSSGKFFYHEYEEGFITRMEPSNMGIFPMITFSVQEWTEKGFKEEYTSDFNASGRRKIGLHIDEYQEYSSIDELIHYLYKKTNNELKFEISPYRRCLNYCIKVESSDSTENFFIYLRKNLDSGKLEVTECYDK